METKKVRSDGNPKSTTTLQALLPFESKPKDPPCRKKKLGKLHSEFREPRQRKVRFCTQLQVLKKEKMTQKENQKRRAQEAMKAKEELISKKLQREKRRRRFREEDEMKKRKTRSNPES